MYQNSSQSKMLVFVISVMLIVVISLLIPDRILNVTSKYSILLIAIVIISPVILFFKGVIPIDGELQKQIRLEADAYTQRSQVILFLIFFIALKRFKWILDAGSLIVFYFFCNIVLKFIITAVVKRKYR